MIGMSLTRFLIGGVCVSAFAAMGTVLKPKSFAGLFGAAPSVALATLVLTVIASGRSYAAAEAQSMVTGAIAFFIYARVCMVVMTRYKPNTKLATASLLVLWGIVAFGIWYFAFRMAA